MNSGLKVLRPEPWLRGESKKTADPKGVWPQFPSQLVLQGLKGRLIIVPAPVCVCVYQVCMLPLPWLGEGKSLSKGTLMSCSCTWVLSKFGSFPLAEGWCHVSATGCQLEAGWRGERASGQSRPPSAATSSSYPKPKCSQEKMNHTLPQIRDHKYSLLYTLHSTLLWLGGK